MEGGDVSPVSTRSGERGATGRNQDPYLLRLIVNDADCAGSPAEPFVLLFEVLEFSWEVRLGWFSTGWWSMLFFFAMRGQNGYNTTTVGGDNAVHVHKNEKHRKGQFWVSSSFRSSNAENIPTRES